MKFGLLGRKLGHSYSPMIFDLLGGYRYDLYEREPEDIEDLLRNGDFNGLNVTIPYKKEVLKYLDEVDPLAARLGSVNTVVKKGGKLAVEENNDDRQWEKAAGVVQLAHFTDGAQQKYNGCFHATPCLLCFQCRIIH